MKLIPKPPKTPKKQNFYITVCYPNLILEYDLVCYVIVEYNSYIVVDSDNKKYYFPVSNTIIKQK
jgi:hypothetical protein